MPFQVITTLTLNCWSFPMRDMSFTSASLERVMPTLSTSLNVSWESSFESMLSIELKLSTAVIIDGEYDRTLECPSNHEGDKLYDCESQDGDKQSYTTMYMYIRTHAGQESR